MNLPLDEERTRARLLTLLPPPLQHLATSASQLVQQPHTVFDVEGDEKSAREWTETEEGEEHPLRVVIKLKTKVWEKYEFEVSLCFE